VNGAPGCLDDGPSAALLDKVHALDTLPRLGAFRTLDLRGNDLRVGRAVSRACGRSGLDMGSCSLV